MFKQFVILGVVSGIGASVACALYSGFYFNKIVDFSSAVNLMKMISTSFMVTMIACFINVGMRSVIKSTRISDFIFNMLFSIATIAFVFILIQANDPEFTTEDAIIMEDYYKGFIMPMLFFPALSWFTFKPLIIKS